MIFRCQTPNCGQRVSRYDEPQRGTRMLFCVACQAQTVFLADAERPVVTVPIRRKRPHQRRRFGGWEGRDWDA